SIPSYVSFDVHWAGGGEQTKISDSTFGFRRLARYGDRKVFAASPRTRAAPAREGELTLPGRLARVTQVDIENILVVEDIRQLLEQSEQSGTIRAADLTEIAEAYDLTELEQDALLRELDQRSIEIVELPVPHSEVVAAITAPVETTTDALQLFLREAG